MQSRALKVSLRSAQAFTPSDVTDRLLLKSATPPTGGLRAQLWGRSCSEPPGAPDTCPRALWASGQMAG